MRWNTVSFLRQKPSAVSTSSPNEKSAVSFVPRISDDAETKPGCETDISADEIVTVPGCCKLTVV
ncbi:MAG TPA: hypothetical protein O0W80_05180 [Methanocorpusculum sp.]|nr:hypothetical protein [Methanocorpusculum sp.]